ncbi:MAG: metalloregulator ArsR/SmtB family transcription factor [Chitinophagaceae bacterium]
MRRDVFQAISDPTRREIINLLAAETLNLKTVAEKFQISRPAISRHIKILTECGLITIRTAGRERFCEVRLETLVVVSEWTNQYRRFWANKLDALELHLSKKGKLKKQLKNKQHEK